MSSTRRDVILGVAAVVAAPALPTLAAATMVPGRLMAAVWCPEVIPVGTVMDYVYRCGLTGATFAQPVRVIASEPTGGGMHVHDTESCGERRAVADSTPLGHVGQPRGPEQ